MKGGGGGREHKQAASSKKRPREATVGRSSTVAGGRARSTGTGRGGVWS
jgi:hypothetical protein